MNKRDELNSAVEAFLARGGKVSMVAEGVSAVAPELRGCRCGCRGNWTEHSMRAGESGRSSSVIIR